jgi:hypothetical protein
MEPVNLRIDGVKLTQALYPDLDDVVFMAYKLDFFCLSRAGTSIATGEQKFFEIRT